MSRCVTFVNADIGGGTATLRIAGSRIVALDPAAGAGAGAGVGVGASAGDLVVDLRGDRLLPGLINAHDHLHLNSLPPLESTGHWRHAREWVAQVNLRRRTDPAFESRVAVALDERLLIGGLKNLLSGVTTVAHHDPLYPFLMGEHFFDRCPHPVWLVAFALHRWRGEGTQRLSANTAGVAVDHSSRRRRG